MKLATLCYIEKDGQYLMMHRVKKENDMHKNLWVGLGGKMEAGESPEDCVIREVFEESGLKIVSPRLRGILTFPNDFNQEDWYVFLFSADVFSGEVTSSREGLLEWVGKNELDSLPMHDGDRLFLKWMEENSGVFSAKLIYENNVFQSYELALYNS